MTYLGLFLIFLALLLAVAVGVQVERKESFQVNTFLAVLAALIGWWIS